MKSFVFTLFELLFLPVLLLSQDWQTYPYQPANTEISFPKDEGAHPGSKMEWWYVNFHLKADSSGTKYGVMVTYFNNQVKILNITDETNGAFYPGSQLGTLNSGTNYLHLFHMTSTNPRPDRFLTLSSEGQLKPFQYYLNAVYGNRGVELFLKALKPPLLISGNGYLPVGSSGSSYYYSLPLLGVHGKLTLAGQAEAVSGIGWLDHQWGNFFVTPSSKESYEWFSVQLNDNRQLVFWDIFTEQNKIPRDRAHKMCTLSFRDGHQDTSLSFRIQRLAFWRDKRGLIFSHGWEFTDPLHDIRLRIQPAFDNQVANVLGSMPFYEGSCTISGTWQGEDVSGAGYAELLHKYSQPKIQILSPAGGEIFGRTLRASWKVLNPDDGVSLTFSVSLVNDSTKAVFPLLKTNKIGPVSLPLGTIPPGLSYRLVVEATSADSLLSGKAISNPFSVGKSAVSGVTVFPIFPNPFYRFATLALYREAAAGDASLLTVSICIRNLLGECVFRREIRLPSNTLVRTFWKGRNTAGFQLPSGVYFAQITIRHSTIVQKIVLLR